MIHVIATIDLNEGCREAFLKEFNRLIPSVLAENGCIEYGPAIDVQTDIAVQSPIRENSVVVIEKWKDLDALKVHLGAPHLLSYRERVKSLVKGVALEILKSAADK